MKFRTVCLLIAGLIYLCQVPARSQSLDATVRGRLTDPAGNALQGVLLRAIDEETLENYQTMSDIGGEYTFSLLPPGVYRFEAEKEVHP